jgi:hypothetical protein
MASMDDIYDMLQKLDNSDTEYLLITIQKGKKNGKADVFYSLKDRKSMKILASGLDVFNQQIDKINEEMDEND